MEERTDEETLDEEDVEVLDDDSEEGPAPEPTRPAGAEGAEVESSLEELLAKREGGSAEEEDDDDSLISLGREERLEPIAVKVLPPTDKEFVCQNCHLVKHRSQIADKSRMFCRDCV